MPKNRKRGELGVPRTMIYREMLPFFSAFYQKLGFDVVLSGQSNKKIIHKGVEVVVNEPCFPIKVAHGHLAELMDRGVKRIALPAVVNIAAPEHPLEYGMVCPYSQTLAYTSPAALDFAGQGVELLSSPVHFGFGGKIMRSDLKKLAKLLGGRSGTWTGPSRPVSWPRRISTRA